jgi:hypothetical protein
MAVTREQIMNALLAQLQAKCGATFATYSRMFVTWQDLTAMLRSPPAASDPRQLPRQPALFLYDGIGFGGGKDEWEQPARGVPMTGKRTLHRTIVLYDWRPGSLTPGGAVAAAGAITMNPLIEAVENAFQPDTLGVGAAVGSLTLGGLVQHAWIQGEGHMIPGDIDPTGLAMQTIPVRILIP